MAATSFGSSPASASAPQRAGRMPDDDDAVRPDEGLLAHKAQRGRDLVRGGAPGRWHNRPRRSRPGPRGTCRRSRHGPGVPEPARQSRAPPATPPARGIPAAAFARDAARSGSRRARSPPAETARRRAGETAPHAPRSSGSGDGTSHCCRRLGSPSAPCAPKPGLRCGGLHAERRQGRPRRKTRLSGCMNWPDAAEGGTYGVANRIPRGESNPAHFFVNRLRGAHRSGDSDNASASSRIRKMPVKAALCPLSVQPGEKLMQKIHRLTDN